MTGRVGIKSGFDNTAGVEASLAVSVGSDSLGDISGGGGVNVNDPGGLLSNSAMAVFVVGDGSLENATTTVDAGRRGAPVNWPPTVFASTAKAVDRRADAGVGVDIDVDSDTSIDAGAATGDCKPGEVAIVSAACSVATCAGEAKTVVIGEMIGEMEGCEVEDGTGAVVGFVVALASAE